MPMSLVKQTTEPVILELLSDPNQQQQQNQSIKEDKITDRLRDICLDFFERTSIHGFSEIKNSPYIVVKIIWVFLVLGCLGYTISVVAEAVQDFLMYDVIVQSKTNYVNSGTMTLPAAWLCYFGQDPTATFFFENFKYLNNAAGPSSKSSYRIVNYFDRKCFVWNSGIASDGKKIDPVSSKIAGSDLGIKIILSFTNAINFSLFVGDNSVRPLFGESYNIRLKTGYEYYISLNKFNNNKLPKPFNNCSDSLTDASSYDSIFYRKVFEANIKYRQLNCLEFCIYKKLTDLCNCSYPTINEVDGRESCLRKDYLDCLYQQNLNSNVSDCEPYCPLECDSVVFASKIQSYPTPKVPNNITLTIFYEEMSYTDYYEVPKTTVFDLVSTFGGVFGLFLGFSLLSFVEIVTLIFNIIALFVVSKAVRNKVNQQ